jgi:hypothetical protein
MNATQWTVVGIIGLAVLGVIALMVKEKIDAARINRLEQQNSDLKNANEVRSLSDAGLDADLAKRLPTGRNPKT